MIYEQLNNIEIKLQSICKFILFISILLLIFVNFSYFFVNDKKNIINVAYAFDNNYEYIKFKNDSNNYGIDHKYYVGMLENRGKIFFKQYNINFNEYINSGVILCNLEELRKQNITNEYLKFFEKFKGNIRYTLNDGLNYVSKGKIGYFSPEYVVIGFCDQKEAFNYYKNMNIKVNRTKVVNSYKDPYIYHFILKSKPWRGIPSYHNKICVDPMTRFYEMARKTSFYYDILKIFSIKFPKTI